MTAGHQGLNRGMAAWNEQSALLAWRGKDRRAAWGGVRHQHRYGLHDQESLVGGAHPLTEQWQAQLEWQHSPTARVAARDALGAELHFQPAQGWNLSVGARMARYRTSHARTFSTSIDRYVGNWRWGYTLYLGGPMGASLKAAHRLQATYHYGDRSWVGLSANAGIEQEGTPRGPVQTRVHGASVSGWHALSPHWIAQRYTRRGVRLGLRHAF